MKPSSAATSRYHKKVYEQIYLFVKKGEKEIIKKAAADEGKSVNEFILEAVNEKMRGV